MDFTKYGLTDEQQALAKADYDSEIAGLKNKNTELIEREKAQKTENVRLTLEQTTNEENAKVALAEKDGDIEKYKIAVAEREETLATAKREFQERDNSRLLGDAVNGFSDHLSKDPAAREYMQNKFKSQIEIVDGVAKPKDVTLTMETLTQSFVTDKANASYIAADVGSGAGATGSNSNNSVVTGKKYSDMTLAEQVEHNSK